MILLNTSDEFSYFPGRISCLSLLMVCLVGCTTSTELREVDAKLMARNFLHGRSDVERAPDVQPPDVPYRYMTQFQAEKVKGSEVSTSLPANQPYWSVRIHVTDGKYKGDHRVIIHPVRKQVVDWISDS